MLDHLYAVCIQGDDEPMETEDSSTAAETSESSEAAAAPAAESESNPEADKPATEVCPVLVWY